MGPSIGQLIRETVFCVFQKKDGNHIYVAYNTAEGMDEFGFDCYWIYEVFSWLCVSKGVHRVADTTLLRDVRKP